MSSYSFRYAELYDLFYADKPYEAEAAFVDKCLREYSIGPTASLLELACGTGTHAFQLEMRGYQIVATDYSKDMIERARREVSRRLPGGGKVVRSRALSLPSASRTGFRRDCVEQV